MRSRGTRGWLWAAVAASSACRTASDDTKATGALAPAPAPEAVSPVAPAAPFERLATCRVEHRGQFIDLGSDAALARRSYRLGPFADTTSDSFSDQSYTRFAAPFVTYDFWLREPRDSLQVRIRLEAGSASQLTASVDQLRLGTLRPSAEAFQTLTFPLLQAPLAAGRHQLALRWSRRSPGDSTPYGMVEWIHLAEGAGAPRDYRPPRSAQLFEDVVLEGVPRRAAVLEAPAQLSCPIVPRADATLALGVGGLGDASSVARVSLRRDSGSAQVLAERRLAPPDQGRWADLELRLDSPSSRLVELTLEAESQAARARVAFSEPRITTSTRGATTPLADLVVVAVASGLQREALPPFGDARRLRHTHRLAEASARFPEYRIPTTVVGGVVATLLTGLPPLGHGLSSPLGRLPDNVQLISERLREVSGASVMFTAVPHTRAVFGFERGWNLYEAFSPVSDVPATAPLERARAWLDRELQNGMERRRFVFLHLRGGHPPWDLSRDEVAELEPREYGGLLEARRGGIIVAQVRNHPRPAQRRLAPSDWTRLRALEDAALAKQDAALGSLLDLLERSGAWERTLFVFAGDVGAGEPPDAPYGAARALREENLLVPLWIKFPGGRFAGTVVPGLVTSADVHATLAAALGVSSARERAGQDLHQLASGSPPPLERPLLALVEHDYATRWGQWLLRGTSGKTPVLCDVSIDPACASDVLAQSHLAAEALWRVTFDEHQRQRSAEGAVRPFESAVLDKDTAAALQVWGD